MAKPIIKQIIPFDASEQAFVNFVWSGPMAYNNRLVVYNADTLRVVYDHTYDQSFYTLTHEIPAGTLANGIKYAVSVAVVDSEGVWSDFSDKYYFWCSATPIFYLKDLSPTADPFLVEGSTYLAELVYSQANNVAIDTYQFFLYNSVKELIDSSDLYRGENSPFRYMYRTLDSNTIYYLRATGSTVQGVPMDTGYCAISVKYEDPSMYAMFYADPNLVIGTVDYRTNIIDIESDLPADKYHFENGYIDLTGSPNSVRYSNNFSIPQDATISIRMKHAHKTCDILKAGAHGKDAWLLQGILDKDNDVMRYKLTAYGHPTNYVIYSDPLDFDAYDIVTLHIRRKNGIYGLYVFVDESGVEIIKQQWFVSPKESDYYVFNDGSQKRLSYYMSDSENVDYAFIDDNRKAESQRQFHFSDKRISNEEYVFCTRDSGKIEHSTTWFVKSRE